MSQRYDPEQIRRDFERDGFAAIKGFLTEAEVRATHEHLETLIERVVPLLGGNTAMYEDKTRPQTLKQMQDLHKHDVYFGRMAFGEPVIGLAELLLGPNVRFDNIQWFNKPPRIGLPTPAHQDAYYWMLQPDEGLTMWLALDHVDASNGCVRYLPGSHRSGMRSHQRTTTLGFSQGISDYSDADRSAEVQVHAVPGDMLVHHAMTVHRADGNSSDRHRRALGFTYFAHNVREDTARKEAYRKALTADLTSAGKL